MVFITISKYIIELKLPLHNIHASDCALNRVNYLKVKSLSGRNLSNITKCCVVEQLNILKIASSERIRLDQITVRNDAMRSLRYLAS